MRFKKLVETILTEDIESMKKYYPNISDEAFQSYVELDPTYKEGSTQAGKYAKWILGLANKGKLDNIGHVKDVLSRFDEEKNNLKEKDIMKYKSVDEVEAMLNDENSYKALSDRQRLRQTQKAVHNTDLDQDAERLFNGKDWEVWTPHTYEASCKLGRGTQWCTASTESDHYFRSYTKSGKLYIIINKHDGEKYQFHFESASFMDAKDESIPIAKFLLDNRELNDYFYAILPDEVKEQVENLKDLADNDYVFVYHGDIPQKMKYVFRYIEKIIVERDITKIPDKEFHKLIGLKEVSLHDNITYIGESAFEDCENLEYINLPHNLEHLGDYAFDGCVRLKSIKINSELQMLPMFAFSYTDAKRIDVPGNINVIGNGAFCNTELQTVVLNEGVQVISSHAFSGSDKLTSIKLPHSLNKIDSRAFRNCTSLEKIVIPKEVEYVGHRVFGNCPNLTVYCEAEEQPIRWETDWNHRAEVVWGYKGEGVKESYKMRFNLDESKADIQKLIDWAGEDLSTRFLSIKHRLESPENDIYYWIKNKSVNDLEKVIVDAERTKSTTQQKIDASVGAALVGENEYWRVYHITSYEASCRYGRDTQWCISGYHDYGNSKWQEYTRNGVQFYFYIAKSGYNSRGVHSKFALAYKPGEKWNVYDQGDKVVDGIPNAPKIDGLPDVSTHIVDNYIYTGGSTSFGRVPDFISCVTVGDGVGTVSVGAFRRTGIKKLVVGKSTHTIGAHAFCGCPDLTIAEIPDNVTSIGDHAFEDCPNLVIITDKGSYAETYAKNLHIPVEYFMGESYKMKFKLTEGKNLEQTVQQYIDKYKKIVPAADDELHRNQVMGLIAIDPTYKEGSTTTGDYAIWILNMAIKNGWDVLGARDKLLPLLTDFMDKKSQLPNKDINSYKSAEDLEVALKNCTLTDRQKERKARNASSKTKKVLETDNWEVYAALNWEGALTLGKGTSWCTATSDNASWYAKYISDIWWDDDWDAFEVRDHAKNHLSEDEIIDMVKNSHISDIEPTTIDDIYANYSDRAVFLTVNNDTTFLVNPYEQVPVEICNTLYVFIRKGYPSERYQFCMSYDLQEIEDDYYNAITFCDASDRAISFDDFVEREPELKAFWTETLGQRLTDLLGDDEEEIEESYSMRFTLTEDIAAVRKNYPKISDEDFDRLIKLDPTYREGSNSVGTYGKWILNLFNKGKLDNEGHVFDILTRFEESKKNLKNKDIGKFKTLEELDDYLNDEDNYKSLSNRQVTRQNQNARRNADLGNESEKVFDGSKWEVWIPKTYAASCKLGQGSSWCTASTSSDYYYNYYTRQGNLFININKHDSEDKYQFHFETGSFMDIDDRPITLTDFLSDSANAELHDFYYPIIAKSIGVEIGGADYDLVLDFNGGAFARVLDYWAENYANRDSVGADFIRQLLTGDGYDLFYYDGMMTIRDSNDLPTISQSVREELKRLGLVIDDLWAIVDEEIEDDEGNEIPYADEILDAVDQATMDAVIVGTEDEAMSDIEKAMTIEDGEGYVFTVDQGNLILSASPETLVDAYLEMSEGELPDILRDDSAIAADILVERWASTFRCYEPQYGWNGFNDDAFNEALADRLSEITA